ncbi:MAG: acetylornithine carbamoyltransferase [Flavobacteriaceae bacterium]|jgi:N-succinyl-L-ornithine transcarbamylase|nr:MAG: acetylornithine carbamoyltransferase [Flavobacteriaceae bacterium]
MNHFINIQDIADLNHWLEKGRELAETPDCCKNLGSGKTLCLLFFNSSLRTRLSTQKAARLLGLEVMVMNFGAEGWNLEMEDGTRMDGGAAEHIREAAGVVGKYADLIGVRAFAGLEDAQKDRAEKILKGFQKYAGVPLLNLESATAHPLQALADALTIASNKKEGHPRVVLSWAPHPRALPQAVPNSFVRMMRRMPVELVITHPEGYELDAFQVGEYQPVHDQASALAGADFVYVKNWSSFKQYGKVLSEDPAWMMTGEKLAGAHFMHCLPVRRNVVVEDAVLDGDRSLVLEQASNRTIAAQLALLHMLEAL